MRSRGALGAFSLSALLAVACFPASTMAACTSPTITITPPTGPAAHVPLPNAYIGVLYDLHIVASGGSPPAGGYFWQDSTAANQIPPGITQSNIMTTIAHDTVLLHGTPSQQWGPVGILGDFDDGSGCPASSYSYTLRIDGPPNISGVTPSKGTAGTDVHISGQDLAPSDMTVTFAGGATTSPTDTSTEDDLHFPVPSNAQSGPIALSSPGGDDTTTESFGAIAAEPTANRVTLTFDQVHVGHPQTEAVTFTVAPGTALLLDHPALPAGTPIHLAMDPCDAQWLEVAQQCTVSVTCDPAEVGHWTGSMSMSANTSDGVVDIPVECTGAFDTTPPTTTPPLPTTTDVGPCPPVSIEPADIALPAGRVGEDHPITASGGTPPYRFSAVSSPGSAYSVGFALDANGTLTVHSDTTYAAGVDIEVNVTDSQGCTGMKIIHLRKPGQPRTTGLLFKPKAPVPVDDVVLKIPIHCDATAECGFFLRIIQATAGCPDIAIGDVGVPPSGSASVPVSGGRGPYTFVPKHSSGGNSLEYSLHEDGSIAVHRTSTSAQTATVVVELIDADGCRAEREIRVTSDPNASDARVVRRRPVTLGSGTTVLAAGKSGTVKLKLTAPARKLLKRHRTLKARLRGYKRTGGSVVVIDQPITLKRK